MRAIALFVALFVALSAAARAATIDAAIVGFTSAELRVVSHVIDYWSSTILDPFTVRVALSKTGLDGDMLGVSSGFVEDAHGWPVSGVIEIDDRAGSVIPWFVDPTPDRDEEYGPGTTPWHKYGRRPGPAGEHYDMLMVLHHEFAHLFGFTTQYTRFAAAVQPYDDVPPLRTFTGSTVTALLSAAYEGTHLSDAMHPFDLMTAYQSRGERIVPSDLDLAMLGDAFGYTISSAPADPVPEPETLLLTGAALICCAAACRLKRHAPATADCRSRRRGQ